MQFIPHFTDKQEKLVRIKIDLLLEE